MIVYTATRFKPKRKKKKKIEPLTEKVSLARLRKLEKIPLPSYKTFDRTIPSLNSNTGDTSRKDSPVYSGERKLLGIACMHKSNLVPVFEDNKEAAVEIARMRRG